MNDSGMDVSYQINRQKIIFIGDIAVGKTSIINVLMGHKFNSEYEASIGVDFFSKPIKYKGKIIKLQIWDSAGQEKFKSLIPNYIHGASLIYIVYDITNKKTFDNLQSWIDFVNNVETSNIVILGNKKDLKDKIEVTYEDAKKFCDERNYELFEISAKSGDNLNNMLFSSVASLPVFLSINMENYSKEQIIETLMKENLESSNNENRDLFADNVVKKLNVINDSNSNNNTGDISLKENANKINTQEENEVIPHHKKLCC